MKLQEKSVDILNAIHKKGGKRARISAHELKQNKNYYFRVVRLEELGYLIVERVLGEKSYYTITDDGYNALIAHKTSEMNECLAKIGMPRI